MWLFGSKQAETEEDDDQELERVVKYAAELHGVSPREVVDTVLDVDEEDLEDDFEDEVADRQRKWWRPGVWVTLVFIGIFFGLGIVGLIMLSHIASGPSASSGEAAFNASIAPSPTPNQLFESPSLIFTYPGVFNTIQTEPNWPDTTERYMIGSSSDYRRSISIMIEDNAAQPSDDSGFKYRSLNPSLYTPSPVTVAGEPATVMVKSDNTERTLYWEHNGLLVVMSVVSTNGTDNLQQFMTVITQSLRWRTS